MHLLVIADKEDAAVLFEGSAEFAPEPLLAEADIIEASLGEMEEGSPEFFEERERGYVEFPAGEGARGFAFPARPFAWAFCRWPALGATALLCFADRDAWAMAAATTRRFAAREEARPAQESEPSSPPSLPLVLSGALRCSGAEVLLARV